MASLISVKDFIKICRICLKCFDTLISISLFNIVEMITKCALVEISLNDGLPNHICESCLNHLQNTFNFSQLCKKSDRDLRELLQKQQIISDTTRSSEDTVIKTEDTNPLEEEFLISRVNQCNDFNINKPIYLPVTDLHSQDLNSFSDVKNLEKEAIDAEIHSASDNDSINIELLAGSKKIYSCEDCDGKFDKVWHLGLHMKQVHKANGVKCEKCSVICYHHLHLKSHEKTHSESNHICDICTKSFSNSHKLKRHKTAHATERPFHCIKCDYSFKDKWVLKKHIKTMHLNTQKYVACHICGKSIVETYLQHHLMLHEKRQTITCNICSKTFYYQSSLEKHIKRIHENVARQCNHLCNICGRGVGSEAELKAHLRTHTGEKPYTCEKCDKKYRTKSALKTHISRAHLDERKYKCTICSRGFYDKNILGNHFRTHTGERPFKCHICDKSFGFKIVLKKHMNVHSL